MIRSTFAGFNMASLAISASQRALDVTGQNLSNINTQGYTRQRLDQISLDPTGPSISNSQYDAKVGQGVMMTGVSQIRDPFLDVQYRAQLPKVGTADAMDTVLAQIGQIFDETDKDAIAVQFNKIISALQNLADPGNTGTDSADTVVRSACEVLLNTIHQNGNQIQEVYDELLTKMDENVVPQINSYMQQIVNLNVSIRNMQILGSPALELQDNRNELIDALATYFPIEVQYEEKNMGGGITVDLLNIDLKLADGTRIRLVSDDQCGEIGLARETVVGEDGTESSQIVEPVEIYVKEAGENPKTYGGGESVLLDALPAEINQYINDIVDLNTSIQNNLKQLAQLQAASQAAKNDAADTSETAINDYLNTIASLNAQINAATDAKTITALRKQRTQAVDKLKTYFPNSTLTSEAATGNIYITDGQGKDYYLVYGEDPGSVSVNKDANGNVEEPITLKIVSGDNTAGAYDPVTAGSALTNAVANAAADIEEQIATKERRIQLLEKQRDEKLAGLEGYLPGITASTGTDGIMSVQLGVTDATSGTSTTLDLISAANVAGSVSVVTETDDQNIVKAKSPLSLSITDANGTIQETEYTGTNETAIADRIQLSINDKISEGVLKGDLDMLNKAEIFDKDIANNVSATDTKGIQYYQNMLDAFVNQFATEMNRLNAITEERPVYQTDDDGNYVLDGDGNKIPEYEVDDDGNIVQEPAYDENGNPVMEPVYLTNANGDYVDENGTVLDPEVDTLVPVMEKVTKTELQQKLEEKEMELEDGSKATYYDPVYDENGNPVMEEVEVEVEQQKMQQKMQNKQLTETVVVTEQPLFETTDGSDTFTATNIKVSDAWMSNEIKINTQRDVQGENNSSDNWNVERMINALSDQTFDFVDPQSGKVFTGTLYECYTSIQGVQSVERQATSQILETHTQVLNQISDSKDSVSGVWMDEEVTSLMKYSQSYNAACRLMTVMDEVLDRLITQTGACGR